MKQLSGSDNLFLIQEKGNQVAHVGGLAIYDPSTAPGGHVRFKAILDFYTRRLNTSKVFRRRLVRAPLNLDRPYWIDEPEIDVEYHIRHIALPHPGDWRQLMIQIARIHARPLDLSKPAWEAYVIEGLDNIPGVPADSFAMYTKFHHAAIDGESGAALIGALHSLTPDPDSEVVTVKPVATIADREPTTLELLARAVNSRAAQVVNATKLAGDLAPLAYNMGRKQLEKLLSKADASLRAVEEDGEVAAKRAPVTRFNHALSPHRVIESVPIAMEDVQRIRHNFPGVTVNDIFMSVSGGAVRKYLLSKDELPEKTMNAMIPISTRGAKKDGDVGNQIGIAAMPVFTNIADAGERLRKVSRGASKGKQAVESVGKDLPAKLFQVLPGVLTEMVVRRFILPQINFTVSNVRGPAVPLYMAGAKLYTFMPINLLLDGMGLSITGFSYNGILWVCAIADRAMVPDPEFFAQCLRESFEEHEALPASSIETSDAAEKPKPIIKAKAFRGSISKKTAPTAKAKVKTNTKTNTNTTAKTVNATPKVKATVSTPKVKAKVSTQKVVARRRKA